MNIADKKFQYLNKKGTLIYAEIYYVKFNDFNDVLDLINKELVDILHADSFYDLSDTKKELYRSIRTKSIIQKYGMVAEFFVHLILREKGYKQYCLYSNLEENSMKKGFDGLYNLNESMWIVESKSAYTSSSHDKKINVALNDLKDKIENINQNNPWMNAVHHINNIKNHNITFAEKVKELSKDYQKGITHDLSEFNIIPSSTLFINEPSNLDDLLPKIKKILDGKDYSNIIILCIDNYIYEQFLEYLQV